MKQTKCAFLFLVLTLFMNAHSAEIFFTELNQKEKIAIESVESIRIHRPEKCASKCIALEKIKIKDLNKLKKINGKDYEDTFNPALILCDRMEGKLKTIFNEKKEAHSVCSFTDDSHFFTWDYLNKHSSK